MAGACGSCGGGRARRARTGRGYPATSGDYSAEPMAVLPADADPPEGAAYRVGSDGQDQAYFAEHLGAMQWQQTHGGVLRTV